MYILPQKKIEVGHVSRVHVYTINPHKCSASNCYMILCLPTLLSLCEHMVGPLYSVIDC